MDGEIVGREELDRAARDCEELRDQQKHDAPPLGRRAQQCQRVHPLHETHDEHEMRIAHENRGSRQGHDTERRENDAARLSIAHGHVDAVEQPRRMREHARVHHVQPARDGVAAEGAQQRPEEDRVHRKLPASQKQDGPGEHEGITHQQIEIEGLREGQVAVHHQVQGVRHPGLRFPLQVEPVVNIREPKKTIAGLEALRVKVA